MMNTLVKFIAILFILSGCRVVVERPSNPEILIIPRSPGADFIYINDSWKWNQSAHSYKPSQGYWVKPKRSAAWIDGHWIKTRGGWRYAKGHWGNKS